MNNEKRKEEERTCRNCNWYVSRMGKCILHDIMVNHEYSCDDHETEHEAEIYNQLIFGE